MGCNCDHDHQSQLAQQLVETAQMMSGRLTELAATLRGNSQNNVLYSGLRRIPSGGALHLQFTVPMASVALGTCLVTSGQEVTVAMGPPADPAPTEGWGVNTVPESVFMVWPASGNDLTIYGPADDRVWIGVWSAPQPPGAGIGSGN